MPYPSIFITVGTTEFEGLIECLDTDEMTTAMKAVGVENLVVQFGRGKKSSLEHKFYKQINVDMFSLRPNITKEILKADLVIGHGGAGTCLDVLIAEKPLLVVVNDALMDNHQTELANQLSEDSYIRACSVSDLPDVLKDFHLKPLKKMQPGNASPFFEALDDLMGYSEKVN